MRSYIRYGVEPMVHGTQDSKNQVPYFQWLRQMKNFIKTKGQPGDELVRAMGWAINQERYEVLKKEKVRTQFPAMNLHSTLHSLQLFIENWTDGEAKQLVTLSVDNGLDTWRKLHHDELPEASFQINKLREEQFALTRANTMKEFRETQKKFERITGRWTELSGEVDGSR